MVKKYQRGKFRYTVLDTETGKLYVRKAVTANGKQRQIWRVCQPQTALRYLKILGEIEREIKNGGQRS